MLETIVNHTSDVKRMVARCSTVHRLRERVASGRILETKMHFAMGELAEFP